MTIPFWCVAVAWLLIYAPRFLVLVGQIKRPEGFDNASPRDQQARLEGLPKRAHAAHQNSFEGFAPFAAAVLIAHLAHADAHWSAILAISYCGLRILYLLLYLGNVPPARTVVWACGMAATAGLFVLSVAPWR
jgi:uncharacterized MAPEG superfamily protein